jgi:hypothetical protein
MTQLRVRKHDRFAGMLSLYNRGADGDEGFPTESPFSRRDSSCLQRLYRRNRAVRNQPRVRAEVCSLTTC